MEVEMQSRDGVSVMPGMQPFSIELSSVHRSIATLLKAMPDARIHVELPGQSPITYRRKA